MRIGLLITSIGNFGQKGFYNAQEIGLAKELDKLADEVIIYKLIPKDQQEQIEKVDGCHHTTLCLIPSKNWGINGRVNTNKLDGSIDILIYFSDTQLMVPKVAKWARDNQVKLYPYIGVIESHSTNPIKKILVDYLFKRNLSVYRKLHCLAKTPNVEKKLNEFGVNNVTVTPVGLDISLLRNDFKQASVENLREKYGFTTQNRVLLFVGRFVPEKQPERMIEIFKEVYNQDSSYRLLMVGMGELRKTVENRIKDLNLWEQVRFIDRIPNDVIWELYCIADAFVNLNQQEIFGMAIMEAMYYGCKVVAWEAPGPDYIIENNVSGYVVSSNQEVVDAIFKANDVINAASKRILSQFTWDNMARTVCELYRKEQ